MLSPVILTVSAVALFLQSVSVPRPSGTDLTEAQMSALFRVCKNAEPAQLERCKARQLRTVEATGSKSNPNNAYNLYNEIDLGGGKLRTRLQEERLKTARLRAASRKTFGEDPTQQSSSLQPRNYIDFIREERLKCMLKDPGRPRNLCLDELGNTARKLMQEARPSEQRKTAQ